MCVHSKDYHIGTLKSHAYQFKHPVDLIMSFVCIHTNSRHHFDHNLIACKSQCQLSFQLQFSALQNYGYVDCKLSGAFQVEVCPWQSSRHNMGMAFRKETWRGLSNCAEGFCSYDDYNWDWSLQRVSQECLPQTSRLKALVARGPRVFHIGEWYFVKYTAWRFFQYCVFQFSLFFSGVHHKKANCDSNSVITKVQKVVKGAKQYFFPAGLTLQVAVAPKKNKLRKGNGGWGDIRQVFCNRNF